MALWQNAGFSPDLCLAAVGGFEPPLLLCNNDHRFLIREELERVIPVIRALRAAADVLISVDTSAPEVITAAVAAGVRAKALKNPAEAKQ